MVIALKFQTFFKYIHLWESSFFSESYVNEFLWNNRLPKTFGDGTPRVWSNAQSRDTGIAHERTYQYTSSWCQWLYRTWWLELFSVGAYRIPRNQIFYMPYYELLYISMLQFANLLHIKLWPQCNTYRLKV